MSPELISDFVSDLISLTTKPEKPGKSPTMNRRQIAGIIGMSVSYVDQRFRGDETFDDEDMDKIIRAAFEMEIKEIIDRYIPDDKKLVDKEIAEYLVTGTLDDNIAKINGILAEARKIGKDCPETDKLIEEGHKELETVRKELQAKG